MSFSLFGRREVSRGSIEYIIVGLGNPGVKYENTRHNAGFMAIDALAGAYNASMKKVRFKGVTGECRLEGKRALLLKPGTFMNLSGQSVTEAMRFYKVPPEKTLILFDDISLPPGRIRIRRKGSDGGHNGMKNIIYLSGSDQFPRIKIGIGAKPNPNYELADWVLSRFTAAEEKEIAAAVKQTTEAAALICSGGIDEAMSRFN